MKKAGVLLVCLIFMSSVTLISQNAPKTTAATVNAAGSGPVAIPITVKEFTNIGAISLSLEYDYSVIQLLSLVPNPLLATFLFNDISIGNGKHRIVMSWFGPGTSLPDESVLLTLNFTYSGGGTSLTWFDSGLSCEYADGNGDVLNDIPRSTYYINGLITPVYSISGSLSYYKSPGTDLPMGNVELWLMEGTSHTATATTGSGSGNYMFNSLPDGNYTIVVHENSRQVGGINATDAAQLNWWSTHPYDIEQVRYQSADVQNDYWIQSTDAYMVQRYFVYGTPFERTLETGTPWTYWLSEGNTIHDNANPYNGPSEWPVNMNIAVNGSNVSANILGMCTGDYNGSFNPGNYKGTTSAVSLISAEVHLAGPETETLVPVRIINGCTIGAVSMILNFPSDLVKVNGLTMTGSEDPVMWRVNGNELRIGWHSMNPVVLDAGEAVVNLRLTTTTAVTQGNVIQITLVDDPLNEIVDQYFQPIPSCVLSIGTDGSGPFGINEQQAGNGLMLGNYPNPFTGNTLISYLLPFAGQVMIEIDDLAGVNLKTIDEGVQAAGNHSIRIDESNLNPGICLATLNLITRDKVLTRTIRIMKIK